MEVRGEFMHNKKALLLLFNGYCEFEITTAISMLRDTHVLHTFALEKSLCSSEAGLKTDPDFTIKEVNPDDYDVLIIPGGDLQTIAEAKELFKWVRTYAEKGKIIAAICSGVYVLAKSDVLNNTPYTVTLSKEQRDFLGAFNEDYYLYKPIVRHKNILTAQGHAYVDFGIELNSMLGQLNEETKDFYKGKRNSIMEIDSY
jgi:protein deglycase